jgi:hypothetical protein
MALTSQRLHRSWEAGLDDPRATQEGVLQSILQRHRACDYGKRHDFANLKNSTDFRSAAPIVSYDDLAPWIDRMRAGEEGVLVDEALEMFTTTSGTTGEPKYLPITRSMNLEQHRSHRIWMRHLAQDHPGLTEGRLLTSVSPAVEGYTPGGIPHGSASGKNYLNQPLPVRRLSALPYEVVTLRDYTTRAYATLAFALAADLTCVTSVNPSTLMLLGERLGEWGEELLGDLKRGRLGRTEGMNTETERFLNKRLHCPRKRLRHLREILRVDGRLSPRAVWPNLAVICTWHGGNAPFYLSRLPGLWGTTPTRCLGLRASEGMFSIPLEDGSADGVLATWGHFMEFLPEDVEPRPGCRTFLADELVCGKRYRMIITTSGGLYRYDLGDIIEVTGFRGNTPLVTFLHKAGKVLSATGEKVTEQQVVGAMKEAGEDLTLTGFSVTLRMADTPRLLLAVEEGGCLSEEERKGLTRRFDESLQVLNVEYHAKRKSERLAPPALEVLPNGSFARYRQRLVEAGRPEGQIKPPHLLLSEEEMGSLAALPEDSD